MRERGSNRINERMFLRGLTIGILILLYGSILIAQGTYYNSIDTTASTFVTDLHNLINPHTRITYDNYKTTIIPNYESRDTTNSQRVVTCIYSGENYVYTPPFAWGTYSREHTWCQSWMPSASASSFESRPEYSDQHHLFPANQNKANGPRSNHPLGNVTTVTSSYLECKLGTNSSGATVFEPRGCHKGDAARALFYMAVCYNTVDGYDWTFNYLNTVTLPGLSETTENVDSLLAWCHQDPPDDWEKGRNEYIYSIQGNRNPFVDHPTWVDLIDFNTLTLKSATTTTTATEPANYATNFSASLLDSTSIRLSWTDAAAGTQVPSGYLLMANTSNSFTAPSDGTVYSTDTVLSDGSAVVNIIYGSGTLYMLRSLSKTTTYYFQLYSYNGSGSTINYKTDGTVPSANATTTGTVVSGSGSADSITALAWEVSGQTSYGTSGLASTTTACSVINSTGLTRGSGVTTSGTAASNAWGGNGWNYSTASAAITANAYVTFGFTVNSGYIVSLTQLSQNYRRSSTGPANGELQYQINGGTWTTIGDYSSLYSSTSSSGSAITPVVLSAIAGLQNLSAGTIVNIRLIPYGASGSSGTWYVYNQTGNDLVVTGTAEVLLPVELSSFSAAAGQSGVSLCWTTATETNNYGFSIERRILKSAAGESAGEWKAIGFVPGNGTSNVSHHYSFVDAGSGSGTSVYRLKQIDHDGAYRYSSEIEVPGNSVPGKLTLSNYPNPFNPTTKIQCTVPADGRVSIKIFNVLGQEVATVFQGEMKAGAAASFTFDASKLSSGIYFSRIEQGRALLIKKMVLMK